MPDDIKRLYNISDEAQGERAQLFHDQATDELALFTAKFPWFTVAWLLTMQDDIDAADNFPTDQQVVNANQIKTGDVKTAVLQGKAKITDLFAYAELAWPTDIARQRCFGQDEWEKNQKSQKGVESALELAHSMANDAALKPALIAKGFLQLDIDQLATLSDEIELKNSLQEKALKNRPITSQDRAKIHNVSWGHMRTINICVKVVHKNDPERKALYNMYPTGSGQLTTVNVIWNRTGQPDLVADVTTTLTNTDLAPQVSNGAGKAGPFQSVNMPQLLKVEGVHATLGTIVHEDLQVEEGEENNFNLEIG